MRCCRASSSEADGYRGSGLRAVVDGAAGASLTDDDAGQVGKRGMEALPDPAGEDFAGGVFEAWDVVEVIVIKLFVERTEGGVEVGEVADPAGGCADVAADVDLDTEGMAVQARAFMARGNVGELVRGFEAEFFEDVHALQREPFWLVSL